MQNVVIDRPYRFFPPFHGRIWARVVRAIMPRVYRSRYGVTRVQTLGHEKLSQSIAAGHGILLTPNHCRESDPLVLASLSIAANTPFFLMASWHLFNQGWLSRLVIRGGGAFSIYREGMDRQAIDTAIGALETAERPVVLFPEGLASRTNDRLNALLEGTSLIARTAARKRSKQNPPGQVVIHPVGIRYRFGGDLEASVTPVLDEIETRLSWRRQSHLSLEHRIVKLGLALLSLKEIEYFGHPREGRVHDRLNALIDRLLCPLESEWLDGQREAHVVARVKRLRAAILPGLIQNEVSQEERERRWAQLADIYVAQQLANYPPDYLSESPTPERLLETVERFEEDLTDRCRPHPPLTAVVKVGDAIQVPPARERTNEGDELLRKVEHAIKALLEIDRTARSETTGSTAPRG